MKRGVSYELITRCVHREHNGREDHARERRPAFTVHKKVGALSLCAISCFPNSRNIRKGGPRTARLSAV